MLALPDIFEILCFNDCERCVSVSLTQTKKKGLDLKKKLVEDVSIIIFKDVLLFLIFSLPTHPVDQP